MPLAALSFHDPVRILTQPLTAGHHKRSSQRRRKCDTWRRRPQLCSSSTTRSWAHPTKCWWIPTSSTSPSRTRCAARTHRHERNQSTPPSPAARSSTKPQLLLDKQGNHHHHHVLLCTLHPQASTSLERKHPYPHHIMPRQPRPPALATQIDLVKGMMDCLYAKCTPCITDCVMAELEKLGQKYRVALKIAKVRGRRCVWEGGGQP
jgi:hypothetical protein